MKLTWSRGRRASRATSIASFLGCCQDGGIILRNYHSRSSVVRGDEATKTLAETEEIWATIRISRVAKTSEIRQQSFPSSSRCRRRPGLLELPIQSAVTAVMVRLETVLHIWHKLISMQILIIIMQMSILADDERTGLMNIIILLGLTNVMVMGIRLKYSFSQLTI